MGPTPFSATGGEDLGRLQVHRAGNLQDRGHQVWARGQLCDEVRSLWDADYSVASICDHYDLKASAVCGMLDIVTLSGISLYLGKTVLERVEELADDYDMSVDWAVAVLLADHPLVADAR